MYSKQNRKFKSKCFQSKCFQNVTSIRIGMTASVGASVKIKKIIMCVKETPAICSCQNDKYEACIIDDSVVIRDEVINTAKTVPTHFNVLAFY